MGGRRLLIVAAVSVAGAVAVAQSAGDGISDTTIQIGVEAAVGSLSLDGENLGFMLAFEEANAAGGVHGRRFVWTERRRASGEPSDVLAVARRMIDDDHAFALVNFSGPAIGDIVAHARSARVPVLFPHTALVSSEGERYLFTSFPRFEGEAEVMFRYLAKERGLRTLAIAHDPNAYGTGFRDRLHDHAARFGYRYAGAVAIASRRPADLSAEFGRLVALAPDAIVMALYPEQAQALMAARARAGWRGRMVSTGPLTDEASLALPNGGADGTLGFCHYPDPEQSKAPGVARYREALGAAAPGTPGRSLHPLRLYLRAPGGVGRGAHRARADPRALHRRDGGHRQLGCRWRDAGGELLGQQPPRAARRIHLRDEGRTAGGAHRLDRAVTPLDPTSAHVLPANRSMPASTVIPVLIYADVAAAATWLCGAFGFRVRLRIADHRIQLVVGDGHVVIAAGAAAPLGHSVMVRVPDLAAHRNRARAGGARVLSPPTEYPYGERQYTVQDPYGHVWTFSESVADVDPAAWGGAVDPE